MRSLSILCACAVLAGSQVAMASSYVVTFTSGKMRPYEHGQGVKGAKLVTATWTIPSLPYPGKCSYYGDQTNMTAYSDGKNTLQTLMAKYQYKPNISSGLTLCLKHDSTISKFSGSDLDLLTNTQGQNYEEYTSTHGEDYNNKLVSAVSISTYRGGVKTKYNENDGNGGIFTLSGTDTAVK